MTRPTLNMVRGLACLCMPDKATGWTRAVWWKLPLVRSQLVTPAVDSLYWVDPQLTGLMTQTQTRHTQFCQNLRQATNRVVRKYVKTAASRE